MKHITLALFAVVLASCASTQASRTSGPSAKANDMDAKLAEAVTTPLTDLNIVRADIPRMLSAAQKGPYAVPADPSCEALSADIQALDAVLGADLDTPPTPANPGLVERGVAAAGEAAVGAVRGDAEDVVPYRSWVRKLTGAERYAKDVSAAIAAGTIRRAYLKGLGQSAGCEAPAAPRK